MYRLLSVIVLNISSSPPTIMNLEWNHCNSFSLHLLPIRDMLQLELLPKAQISFCTIKLCKKKKKKVHELNSK